MSPVGDIAAGSQHDHVVQTPDLPASTRLFPMKGADAV